MSDETYLEKIAALLRQSESTNFEEEAKAFQTAAQKIATAAAIDLEVARSFIPERERKVTLVEEKVYIFSKDMPVKGLATYVRLFLEVAAVNDLKCNISHNSRYVYAFGFKQDIETTKVLYAAILPQMVQASNAFIASGKYKKELVRRPVWERDEWGQRYVVGYEHKPVHGVTARLDFQRGYARRVGVRLKSARAEAIKEAERQLERERLEASLDQIVGDVRPDYGPSTPSSLSLVMVEKADRVHEFYKATSDAQGKWRGERGTKSITSRDAGRAAADNARLGR